MDLFTAAGERNLLPQDGEVNYYGKICSPQQAQQYFDTLLHTIEWKNDEAVIFGKHFITKRKVAWYAADNLSYTYSNITKTALPFTGELLELKRVVEKISGAHFNACLLNLYHNGSEGMGWHSDDEKALEPLAPIASLSFGAERKFAFKHKINHQTISLQLESGSLLVMKGATQNHWLHRLPPTTKITTPRVNLTFRNMVV